MVRWGIGVAIEWLLGGRDRQVTGEGKVRSLILLTESHRMSPNLTSEDA